MFSVISKPAELQTFSLEALFVLVGAIAVAGCILVPEAGLVVVIGCVALWFLALVGEAVRGRIDGILLCWAAALPLGPYFLSFPRDHSLVTLDRVVILLAFLGLYFANTITLTAIPRVLRQAGLAVLVFTAVAAVSLRESPNVLNSAQNMLEGFVLPPLLGWCVIARFAVRGRLPTIHTAICISSIISAAVAAAEIVTGQDVLPNQGSGLDYAGGGIPRPNGPFATNDTLALIGAVSFFLLLFLRAAVGPRLSAARADHRYLLGTKDDPPGLARWAHGCLCRADFPRPRICTRSFRKPQRCRERVWPCRPIRAKLSGVCRSPCVRRRIL